MDFLQQLEIKPKQQKRLNFEYNINKGVIKVTKKRKRSTSDEIKEDVETVEQSKSPDSPPMELRKKGYFIDKTNMGFDRNNFLFRLKRKGKVKSIKSQTSLPKEKQPEKPEIVNIASPTKTMFNFIKKTNRRIRLVGKPKKGPRKATKKRSGVRRAKDIPIPEGMVSISEFEDRIYEKAKPINLKYSSFYLNNKEIFVNYINSFYKNYKKELNASENITCESIEKSKKIGEFSLLTHQKIVRDYINLKTPYRGLLLYHGLGAGKTCGSVAIAEGLKSCKKIVIMAPASLIPNYIGELKFCGDPIYKLKQFWEFISTDGNSQKESQLSQILSIPKSFIKRQKGAWLVNKNKKSNFKSLTSNEKESLNKQINKMIESKYNFIAYNGYRMSHLQADSNNFTQNPFDNKVIIVDEAHNLVSRIVNKIKNKESLSYKLYDYLMSAQRCKIILLTGTPIINYPNEIGILFNILRGYIKTYKIKVRVNTSTRVDLNKIKSILKPIGTTDYIDYSPQNKLLTITRNPFGFVNDYKSSVYKGVKLDETGKQSEADFIKKVKSFLFSPRGESNDFIVFNDNDITVENYKALPDTLDEFNSLFKNPDNTVKNPNLFKKRILGLTSYFRSAQETLMPSFDPWKNLHIIKVDMSDTQLNKYQLARDSERSQAKKNAKKMKKAAQNPNDLYNQTTSTYRIFSRAFCNFVFPNTIERPMPKNDFNLKNVVNENLNEADIDAIPIKKRLIDVDGKYTIDDEEEVKKEMDDKVDLSYDARIKECIDKLRANSDEYLSIDNLGEYSPKFVEVYNNIVEKDGLHLIYSQFKTLEGIGIFKLVLEANGFAEFKIKKNRNGIYQIDISEGDKGKPMFASYTGDEEVDEKEILRWVFNSEWDKVPRNIKDELVKISPNNHYGEIIKLFMITASGAEGITLKNTRHVHILEPYWHPVRVEQVIGRARRICSHEALKDSEKTVDVYIYLATFSEEQMKTDGKINQELKVNDLSKIDGKTVMTTDETLWEISQIKESINKNILLEVKESSIDCQLHNKADNPEQLKCYSFGKVSADKDSHLPNIDDENKDDISKINKRKTIWKGKKVKINSTIFVAKLPPRSDGTLEIYDYDSFKYVQKYGIGNTIFVGYYDTKQKKLIEI